MWGCCCLVWCGEGRVAVHELGVCLAAFHHELAAGCRGREHAQRNLPVFECCSGPSPFWSDGMQRDAAVTVCAVQLPACFCCGSQPW